MQSRKLYMDTAARSFVASPDTTLPAGDPFLFAEDVEALELYFLEPTGSVTTPYSYADYSANTVKLAIGLTQPAALQTSWSTLPTTITVGITSLTAGGSGNNEVQRITFDPRPGAGSWAIVFPARSVSVSSVASGVFTAAEHGLYSGQAVTLSAFTLTASAVANGSSYFVIRNTKDAFSLASSPNSTTPLAAQTTSGGGTVDVGSVTTPQLPYNASPDAVQSAIAASGLAIGGAAQIAVSGTTGKEYVLTYGGGSANRDYANVTLAGNTLAGPAGLSANLNLNTAEIAALIAAGNSRATLEIEVSDGTRRQTYQRTVSLGSDVIDSTSSAALATTTASGFVLMSSNGTVWEITPDNAGVLQATATGGTSAPSGLLIRSANGTGYTLSITNTGTLQTTPA
jgi:hypothetical protein